MDSRSPSGVEGACKPRCGSWSQDLSGTPGVPAVLWRLASAAGGITLSAPLLGNRGRDDGGFPTVRLGCPQNLTPVVTSCGPDQRGPCSNCRIEQVLPMLVRAVSEWRWRSQFSGDRVAHQGERGLRALELEQPVQQFVTVLGSQGAPISDRQPLLRPLVTRSFRLRKPSRRSRREQFPHCRRSLCRGSTRKFADPRWAAHSTRCRTSNPLVPAPPTKSRPPWVSNPCSSCWR